MKAIQVDVRRIIIHSRNVVYRHTRDTLGGLQLFYKKLNDPEKTIYFFRPKEDDLEGVASIKDCGILHKRKHSYAVRKFYFNGELVAEEQKPLTKK